MKFEGKADVKGFLARMSTSLRRKKPPSTEETDDEVSAMADSFIGEDQLKGFKPKGKAGMEVVGTTADGAINMDFTWDERADSSSPAHRKSLEARERIGNAPSTELDVEPLTHPQGNVVAPALKRHGGRHGAKVDGTAPAEGYVRPEVPKLSIVVLICGTRGDVQPFIALGLKLKEYGHRIRIATHKDYRKFVTNYGLEFYPLGGDPKILSDFIVKHRGVFTYNTKDAFENIKQVDEIVFTSLDACIKPDAEGDGQAFKAEAIIANPPAYGHIHCAEKLQIPLHIFFTMPWTPTRHFPHPLARIKNVRDTRPSSIAIRNYLSYIIVNEYTYTGLSSIFNRFRKEVLHLPPIRMGNSGATLLDTHNVPFGYCWSPSLVAKPSDWDDHIDVTGYFFLDEGARGSYKPHPELEAFLAAGPAPVYVGFGSLIVDDHEKVTQKILDAIKESGQRLLLSRGWAKLGEGFDLPETVLLLDDVPHDWLLPQCSAVVHHGGAGTTAAGLIAACPTTVIPFFGDQAFWGSACFRRGVGPRPIPIDSLTTKKLVAALEYMQKPEVKIEAVKVSEQIKAEDGVAEALRAFHRHLPVEDLIAGRPIEWDLAPPSVAGFFSELGGGIADLFVDPYKGAKEEGVVGAFKGMGKGLESVVTRPIKGFGIAGYSIWETVQESSFKGPKCLQPQTRGSDDDSPKARSSQDNKVSSPRHSSSQDSKLPPAGSPACSKSLSGLLKSRISARKSSAGHEEAKSSSGAGAPTTVQPDEDPLIGESVGETPHLYKRTFSFRMAPQDQSSEGMQAEGSNQAASVSQETALAPKEDTKPAT